MRLNGYAWAAVALAAGCGSSSEQPGKKALADPASAERSVNNPQVFPPDSDPYGTSMQEWAYTWTRWLYSIPAATNPNLVPGQDPNQNQPAHVFFIADGPDRAPVFTVSRHKSLGLMLSQIANDFPCPDPSFHPAPGQSLFDFLSTGLKTINDDITVLDVTLDGVPVHDAFRYRFTSKDLFFFTGDPSLEAAFDPCVTGTAQPAVADDLFLIFKPLPPGQHTLTTHIVNSDGNVFDRTRIITSE
jgi:hypothetical protein